MLSRSYRTITKRVAMRLTHTFEFWKPKALVSITGAATIELLRYIGLMLGQLIYVEPVLLVALLVLIALDFVTGVLAAARRGEALASIAIRRTIDKLITYTTCIIGMAVLANMFAPDGSSLFIQAWRAFTHILLNGTIGFFAFTEVVSIFENRSGGNGRGRQILVQIWRFASTREVSSLIDPPNNNPPSTQPHALS
jgi:phage-related holin